jgi:signal transduction histidine kinase/DNA-binding response OmpR family regulator
MDSIPSAQETGAAGELGRLIREKDWSKTPIGPMDRWSPTLQTIVNFLIFNRFPILLWWGPDYVSIYNDAYRPILGTKHPDALGLPFRDVWPEIKEVLTPLIDAPFQGGPATWMDDILLEVNRYGFTEETHFTIAYSPVPDETAPRGIGGVIATVNEITDKVVGERRIAALRDLAARTGESKTAEEACALAARALQSHDKDIPFALIYLLDANGESARLVATAGVSEDAPAAISPISVTGAPDGVWPLGAVHAAKSAATVEGLGRKLSTVPAGPWSDRPDMAVVVPIRSMDANQLAGFLVAGVSPRLRLDEQYRSFLDLVAAQIATAITSARAYEEERRRAEALSAIDRAKTLFFSNVSHEFRTPLTLMLGPLTDVIAAGNPLDGAPLELVHRNSVRLLKLVNSLLDFSRIEAGRTQANYTATDLATLTAELASNFRSACERAGLRLVVDCQPLSSPVHVDHDMWEKIVLNLLSNAFKFTFAGTIEIAVREVAGAAQLTVRDSGVGIPDAETARVFERFHRIEGQKSRTHEGSGIGLALVLELVKLHGGTIDVDSTIGRGTTFTVRLPLGIGHLPSDRRVVQPTLPSTSVHADAFVQEALRWLPDHLRSDLVPTGLNAPAEVAALTTLSRVLVADDNADMRDYVRRLLADRCDVRTVADGRAALDDARQHRPDLILADVMMPELDGFGLLRELRADPALRDIPVILLSARAGEEAKIEGLQAGADDYLVKPFNARELTARVASNIELARARAQNVKLLQEEAQVLELLNKVGSAVAAEHSLERTVQTVTDAATELTGAAFGSFFYNVLNEKGESYTLYSLSGVPREAFSKFPMPRNTAVFAPTFKGEGIVRSDDISKDPRYGRNEPHHGMPEGHLPVRSYLAAPVISRSGEVLGGLFFGHPEPGIFTDRSERLLVGIAAQAAAAIDKARLFQALEHEVVERRRAESALQTLNTTLEQRVLDEVYERSKAEDQLRQIQKMEAVGQLTGGIAHDFNNMLAVIIGGLNLIHRKLAKGETDVDRFIDGAIDGAKRAAALTQRLLAFSRQQPLAPESLNLNKLVSSMTDLLGRTLGEHIRMETVLAAGLWQVRVDPVQLESTLLNLSVNARDAMTDGGRLTIETSNAFVDDAFAKEYAIPPGQYVLIAVADTGAGMAPDVLAKAFDPFFTTKGIGKGTGLGLSQVYGFVRQSGGHVKIYSESGIGTTVKVYLPRHYGEAQQPAFDASLLTTHRGLSTEIVMVVEDDERVRTVSIEALKELGYGVIEAAGPQDALRMLNEGQEVTLLFTDVVMPEMSGRELADRARARIPALKVLYTTGYTRNAIVHNGILDAGTTLLSKPFSLQELALKVRRLIDG